MSDATTTTTPIAAFDPANRFVTFEGLKDYDANLISNLHSLGYNNKVSGANIFAWGNNNQIDGQNLFVFGNKFLYSGVQSHPSLFVGTFGGDGDEHPYKYFDSTLFGVWGGHPQPIFKVSKESLDRVSYGTGNARVAVHPNGFQAPGFSLVNGVGAGFFTHGGESVIKLNFASAEENEHKLIFNPNLTMSYVRRNVPYYTTGPFTTTEAASRMSFKLKKDNSIWGWDEDEDTMKFPSGIVLIRYLESGIEHFSSLYLLTSSTTICLASSGDGQIAVEQQDQIGNYDWDVTYTPLSNTTGYFSVTSILSVE